MRGRVCLRQQSCCGNSVQARAPCTPQPARALAHLASDMLLAGDQAPQRRRGLLCGSVAGRRRQRKSCGHRQQAAAVGWRKLTAAGTGAGCWRRHHACMQAASACAAGGAAAAARAQGCRPALAAAAQACCKHAQQQLHAWMPAALCGTAAATGPGFTLAVAADTDRAAGAAQHTRRACWARCCTRSCHPARSGHSTNHRPTCATRPASWPASATARRLIHLQNSR